jgi:hypothetical protein
MLRGLQRSYISTVTNTKVYNKNSLTYLINVDCSGFRVTSLRLHENKQKNGNKAPHTETNTLLQNTGCIQYIIWDFRATIENYII